MSQNMAKSISHLVQVGTDQQELSTPALSPGLLCLRSWRGVFWLLDFFEVFFLFPVPYFLTSSHSPCSWAHIGWNSIFFCSFSLPLLTVQLGREDRSFVPSSVAKFIHVKEKLPILGEHVPSLHSNNFHPNILFTKGKKKINSGQIGNVWEATVPFSPFSIEKDWTNCNILNLWGEYDKFWRKYWLMWRKRFFFPFFSP